MVVSEFAGIVAVGRLDRTSTGIGNDATSHSGPPRRPRRPTRVLIGTIGYEGRK
jgi:hypothetical protein